MTRPAPATDPPETGPATPAGPPGPRRFVTDPGRLRVNPYVARLAEFPELILSADQGREHRGRWSTRAFDTPGALFLEIGPGNGSFLTELSGREPDARFVGIEIRYKRCWLTARKLAAAGRTNTRVLHFHGGLLPEVFAPGELHGVYINHPDPWPRDRQQKNRLLRPDFCRALETVLAEGAEVWVKSDFLPYLPVVRDSFAAAPSMVEVAFCPDVNDPDEPLARGDIQTRYQQKFLERGHPVFRIGFRKDPAGRSA